MGRFGYNIFGSGERTRKYQIGASFPRVGVIACGDPDTPDPLILPTTTTCVDSVGLNNDTATYSATPAVGATGIITVSYLPYNVYFFRAAGSATEGVALSLITETAGDVSTPDTVTGTLPTANSMVGGTVWRYRGEGQPVDAGRESRMIVTHTSTTSLATTIDFEYPINIGDQFLMVPWTIYPGDGTDTSDGNTNVQFTTNFQEADATIATGTGALVTVSDIILRGTADTEVGIILTDHPYNMVIA